MRRVTFSLLAVFFTLAGCGVTTELPLWKRDIRICGPDSDIIEAVRSEASRRGLSFHYGTHAADFGTQMTFRLIGDGFEIVLFNAGAQDDFSLRVYGSGSVEDDNERAISEFTGVARTISTDPALACGIASQAERSEELV